RAGMSVVILPVSTPAMRASGCGGEAGCVGTSAVQPFAFYSYRRAGRKHLAAARPDQRFS
ncbi:MAG: hypothetical protein M3Q39_12510, partial [Actinomycetota bacterium]|nr:hypothetical protein [Actinomycetota bacterium]